MLVLTAGGSAATGVLGGIGCGSRDGYVIEACSPGVD